MNTSRLSVSARIYSSKLSVDEISGALNLAPTDAQHRGVAISKKRPPFKENMWEYRFTHADGADLGMLCDPLLKLFEDRCAAVKYLANKCRIVFWVGCFTNGPEISYEILPDTMRRMGDIGATIYVSAYFTSSVSR